MKLAPFIELVRRIAKSKYPILLMHNRMIMQCYTIDEDSDVGLHYILHIPDDDPYTGEIYDSTLLLNHADILGAYKAGHTVLTEEKKKRNAKPKEVHEDLDFEVDETRAIIKMQFVVQDELVYTAIISTKYPVDSSNPLIGRILDAYTKMLNLVKVGGYGIALDGIRHGLYDRAIKSPRIVYYPVKIGNCKVRIPVCKSMLGAGNCDAFYISVQETDLPSIYIYTIQLEKKKLIEQWIGYIVAF